MEVILREEIENLGKIGEKVRVAPGYARNYLIPKNKAYLTTPGNLKRIEYEKRKAGQLAEAHLEEARRIAAKLSEMTLDFNVKVGEDEKLYGSVSAHDIGEKAAEKGFDLDRRKIVIDEPIKKLGVYKVGYKVHPGVVAEIKVWVVPENSPSS
ncbi:MAG: 50S ribosomal protein L9 [Gemmatimonadota bacterium]|nr:50S ribosomal protein L9 [Gemmatimonadota bacterium]